MHLLSSFFFRVSRRFSSVTSASIHPAINSFDGYTRSSHIKPLMIEVTQPDGSLKKIATGLIDNSNDWIGDQFVSIHMKLSRDYDITMDGFAERARKRLLDINKRRQVITSAMVERMGSLDLAVAHVVCCLGGRVQFVDGQHHWHQRYNSAPADLPQSDPVGDLKLMSIDLSGTPVMYEGLKMFSRLADLRILRLRRCLYLDDHCLSLVGQITQSPLELLDIGECHRITANGIASLTELKSLRHLLVQGNPTLEDKELVCLLLESHIPHIYIEGVDYLGKLPEDARNRVLALELPEPLPRLETKSPEKD